MKFEFNIKFLFSTFRYLRSLTKITQFHTLNQTLNFPSNRFRLGPVFKFLLRPTTARTPTVRSDLQQPRPLASAPFLNRRTPPALTTAQLRPPRTAALQKSPDSEARLHNFTR